MSFVSLEFIIFAALVVPLFFWMRQNLRWLLLLGASYLFYAYWQPIYLLLILFLHISGLHRGASIGARGGGRNLEA